LQHVLQAWQQATESATPTEAAISQSSEQSLTAVFLELSLLPHRITWLFCDYSFGAAAVDGRCACLQSLTVPHTDCYIPACRARVRAQSYTFLDWLQVFLPCVKWLRSYRIKEFLLVRAGVCRQTGSGSGHAVQTLCSAAHTVASGAGQLHTHWRKQL
jgi:hypothetical protein